MISNYLLITANLYKKEAKLHRVLIQAAIIWALSIYVGVLFLSCIYRLEYMTLAIAYIFANACLLFRVLKKKRIEIVYLLEYIKQQIRDEISAISKDRVSMLMAIFIALYAIGLGIVACLAVPYNYDSISYHAPRVYQWVQNKSVLYYASHIIRQNISTVLSSYISTVIYILTGKITGALCVLQYISNIVCLIIINYLCGYYSVGRRLRLFASVLWITLPIGFAEAITPQNDIVAAMWLLMFVVVIIDAVSDTETNYKTIYSYVILLAILIALAYLTKPAVCFAMVIFLVWYLIACLRKKYGFINIFSQCILAVGIILILICPQLFQNYVMSSQITAADVGPNQLVATLLPEYLFINCIKNLIYNFAFNAGGLTNAGVISTILYGLAKIVNIDLNAEVISEGGFTFKYATLPNYSCDSALAFTLTVLMAVAIIAHIYYSKKINNVPKAFIRCSYLSFIFFCIFLRWQLSITRYMVGYFAILIVAIAIIFSVWNNNTKARIVFAAIMFISAILIFTDIIGELYYLYKIHPVIPIKSSMTMYNNNLQQYLDICDYINDKEITELGLVETECDNEYPIWLMLNKKISIRHVNLNENNHSKKYELMDIVPEAIISTRDLGEEITCHNKLYRLEVYNECWYVYE